MTTFRNVTLLALGITLLIALLAGATGIAPSRAWLVAVNLVTLLVYAVDKQQARSDGFRIPEATLHVLALAGGSPAALFGQVLFNHKTRGTQFRLVFLAILLAQGLFLLVLSDLR